MKFITLKKNLLRLYHSYIKNYFNKLIISLLLSIVVAGSTASIAWLLDPAIEKMFMEQDKTMMLLIPIAIVIAFAGKGVSLYFARVILIKVGNEIVTHIQKQIASKILKVPFIILGGVGSFQDLVDGYNANNEIALAAANIFHFTEQSVLNAKKFMFKNHINVRI